MGDASSFIAGCDKLQEDVGTGPLTGKVEVDQSYALRQHEDPTLNHPRGGEPFYLINPLIENANQYLATLAGEVLGGDLRGAMILNMENLTNKLPDTAPVDAPPNFIKLRFSGSPQVFDNGAKVYHRPPLDPRETPEMKAAEQRLKDQRPDRRS